MSSEVESMLSRLEGIKRNVYQGVRRGLVSEGEAIMERSKAEFVPEATGALKDSGNVTLIEDGTIDGLQVVLSYGDEKTGAYALSTHETPSGYDPPTWEGKAIKFTKGGSKYLERPLLEAENGMVDRIAGHVKL